MRKPPFIAPGSTIGLVAPSFGAAIEPYITRYEAAVRKMEERGYRVKAADSCRKSDGLGISTNPESAARDVMEFYLDDEVDALISVGGGELMNETISRLDFEVLGAAKPKWFMGYSDNTNFIYPMATLFDVPGIYGPCATGFGKPWEETEKQAFGLLEGTIGTVHGYDLFELPEDGSTVRREDPLARYQLTEKKILRTMVPDGGGLVPAGEDDTVSFDGTLLGGCLDVLANLSGTSYDGIGRFRERHRHIIWILEACDLQVMSIRRTLWSLRNRGWFDGAAGFLIGRPLAAFREEMMGVDAYNAVTDMLGDFGVPVIMDADIGHVSPMMPVVIGADARVTVRGNDLSVRMDL